VIEVLFGFVRALREAGVGATPERVQTAVAALEVTEPAGLYWAGRLTLCAEPDDIAVYDAVFRSYFGGDTPGRPAPAPSVARRTGVTFGEPGGSATVPLDRHGVAAGVEVLRHRDVAGLSAPERAEVRRLLALLSPAPAPRPGRRRRPAARGEVDPARTARRMLRAAGEPTLLARRRRRPAPRRLVLLVDVSGSMAPYADALLRFGHAAVRRRPWLTEVFTLGTRLTRISRALRYRDPDVALHSAGRVIPDWQGGTRLGEALRAFLDRWGQRGTARDAVVVIFSDGWERGDPALLASQLARLGRLAHRVVWVNPHRGRPGYEPLAAGMAAALPHLDHFVAGHSFAALEDLVEVISRA